MTEVFYKHSLLLGRTCRFFPNGLGLPVTIISDHEVMTRLSWPVWGCRKPRVTGGQLSKF